MTREEAKRRATELVAKMTTEEKASQLRYDSPAIDRLGIPEYNWWNEGLHGVARAGVATVFPQAIGLAASFDTELLKDVGDAVATEGRAKYNSASSRGDRDIYKGLTFWSPNVNIFRDPRWGRGHETYGEDPYLTSRLGVNFIEGLQGDGEYMKAAACAKHYAVHSGPEAIRHSFDAKATPKDLEETYLPAFEACVKEAKVEAVMGAYNRVNGEPACANHPLMEDVLRDKWGFEGHFVSDCWAIRDFHENHKVTSTPEESAALALKTGCDVNCGCTYEKLMEAYDQGLISDEDLDRSCIRLFTTRFLLGMFDKTEYDDLDYRAVESREHIDLSHRAARESLVLLKNTGVLPLDKKEIKTIAVIGPNADSRQALIGNYHGTSSRYVTVLEGIQDILGEEARVLYSQGCHLYKESVENLAKNDCIDRLAEARAVAELADVVVLVVGLDETLEGEEGDTGNSDASGDKLSLYLPDSQRTLMDAIFEDCSGEKPIIVINMTGSCIDLRQADEAADAIIQAWYPGARGGSDIAGLIFGEYSPSGKLPVTFYDSDYEQPEVTDYSMKRRTYRYMDGEAFYPFGFGLTYGDCRVDGLNVTVTRDASGTLTGADLTIEASNAGKEDTDDVLQIYIRSRDSADATPNPSLCGFRRVHIKAGEKISVGLHIDRRSFTTVDDKGVRDVTGHVFDIYAGFSCTDERSARLTGHECAVCELNI